MKIRTSNLPISHQRLYHSSYPGSIPNTCLNLSLEGQYYARDFGRWHRFEYLRIGMEKKKNQFMSEKWKHLKEERNWDMKCVGRIRFGKQENPEYNHQCAGVEIPTGDRSCSEWLKQLCVVGGQMKYAQGRTFYPTRTIHLWGGMPMSQWFIISTSCINKFPCREMS